MMNYDQDERYYNPFPYKSYEEIVAEKRRKTRRRRTLLLFVLLLTAFIAATLYVGFRLSSYRQPERADGSASGRSDSAADASADRTDASFSLPVAEDGSERDTVVIVSDVSAVVKAARRSVVGVTTESYSSFSISSSGSGIIASEDGYIITNNHVISGGESLSVTLDDGTSYPAYLIGSDESTDLAVIKIEATGLPAAEFGDSDLVEAGQAAIAIGNPTGQLRGTVTAGIISAVNRNVVVKNSSMNLIQTDAAINSGNSGGPLLNQYGQVIGINSVKVSASGYEGLGFAIPVNTARPIIEQLIKQGYVSGRPLVGIYGRDISPMAALMYSYPQGVYVDSVSPESSAAAAGVSHGDIVVSVDGTRVASLSEACSARNEFTAGDSVTISVYRRGKVYDIEIELMEAGKSTGDYNF
ncbi:MAG: trypsin-like peptidase domain-containing protein [Clostridia bacterium]|nr:trypsin-like peptidase domain-containing protein [Clostridia bacterium]